MNTFHAFVKKAKTTSDQFAKIIEDVVRADLIEETELEPEPGLKSDSVSMMLMQFDVEPEETVTSNEHISGADLDLIVNKDDDDSMEPHEIENDSKWNEKKNRISVRNFEKIMNYIFR